MRFCSSWKLLTPAGISLSLATPTFAGENAADSGVDLAKQTTAVTANLMKTISDAIQGDGAAQQVLLQDYLAKSLMVIAVILISYVVASAISRAIGKIVSKKIDQTLGKFLGKAIRNLLMIVVGMIVLEMNGINVAGFAAILAALGFAIGMALQGTLSNFAAGIMLLIFRPFKIGDYIVVDGTEGTVEEIDLFTTRVNTRDNRHVIIPNGSVFGNKIENYTRNPYRRVEVAVGTGYACDLKQTRAALQRAVESVSDGSEVPEPSVVLMGLGASSIDWQLRVWCHPQNYPAVKEHLTEAAKESLDLAGISIPYPQMDIHVAGKLLAKAAA